MNRILESRFSHFIASKCLLDNIKNKYNFWQQWGIIKYQIKSSLHKLMQKDWIQKHRWDRQKHLIHRKHPGPRLIHPTRIAAALNSALWHLRVGLEILNISIKFMGTDRGDC